MKNPRKRPTMADVALLAGVGIATVDRVLTGRRKVREENVRLVFKAAAALGYHATPVIRYRLLQDAPRVTFGFILPKKEQVFYQNLTSALNNECNGTSELQVNSVFRYTESQDPSEHAEALVEVGEMSDIVSASLVNHALVERVVNTLTLSKKPVFAMLNDFAPEMRRKFVGLDNFRAGRQAGWILRNIIREPAKIIVLIGGNLWQAHQQRESGFRSFFREHAPEFKVQDAVLNLETRQVTYAMVKDILASQADLRGIYVTGGGVEGAIDALNETGLSNKVKLIVHTLTTDTRAALDDGLVSMIIGTPTNTFANAVVSEMITAYQDPVSASSRQVILMPEIHLPGHI